MYAPFVFISNFVRPCVYVCVRASVRACVRVYLSVCCWHVVLDVQTTTESDSQFKEKRARAQSLLIERTDIADVLDDSRQQKTMSMMVPSTRVEEVEEEWRDERRSTTTGGSDSMDGGEQADVMPVKKTSISHSKSIEVLYDDGQRNGVGAVSDSDGSSGQETGTSDGHMEVNVHTEMSPTTLRDLADLLERLQATDKDRRITVHVHMHQDRNQ